MDLNELLHAHQVEVMKASASGDESHLGMIAEYAERIRQLRTISHTRSVPHDASAPPTIIYGSYAGHSSLEGTSAQQPPPFDAVTREQSENPDRGRALENMKNS